MSDNVGIHQEKPLSLTHAYSIRGSIQLDVMNFVLRKLCSEYRILTTKFYRNEKIYDADWEAHLDSFAPKIETQDIKNAAFDLEDVLKESALWRSKIKLECPFGILVLRPISIEYDWISYVLFSSNVALLDHRSLSFISNETFRLYDAVIQEETYPLQRQSIFLSDYKALESDAFQDVAIDYRVRKQDIAFWRQHLTEVIHDVVTGTEKVKIKNELQKVNQEMLLSKRSLLSLQKRQLELENELSKLRKQRSELDEDQSYCEKSTFIDSVTGEIIHISLAAKNALIRSVLGDEAIGENITGLLDKHDVSKEVQKRISADTMTLDAFANIRDANLEYLGLLSKDRKKITALAEYVRNRIQESFHEQTKVKFMLERKIATIMRALETAKETILINKNSIESNDDMSIRLNNILNPPQIEKVVDMITLKQVYENSASINDEKINKYDLHRFEIEEDVVFNLQRFRSAWAANIRNKKKDPNDSSDHESLFGSDGEDLSDQQKSDNNSWTSKKTVNVVCLAAFAVLMKHVSGMDKFILGIIYSFRYPGQIIGPLTDTLPFNLDLSDKKLTFDGLFASLFKVFHNMKRHGKSCPSSTIFTEFGIDPNIPVQFEFITNVQRENWESLGISVDELFYEDANISKNHIKLSTTSIGSLDEQNNYDVKMTLIENGNKIIGAIRYRAVPLS